MLKGGRNLKIEVVDYVKLVHKETRINGITINDLIAGDITHLIKQSNYYQRRYCGDNKSVAKILSAQAMRLKGGGHLIAVTWSVKSTNIIDLLLTFLDSNGYFWDGKHIVKKSFISDIDAIEEIEGKLKDYYGSNSIKDFLDSKKVRIVRR